MKDAIIAVISTVIGTILGWILANVRTGKLFITLGNFDEKLSYVEPNLMSIPGKQDNELYLFTLCFTIQLYNSSQQNMSIRDCCLQFISKEGEDIMLLAAQDTSTSRRSGGGTKCDSIDVYNVAAQTSANINAVVYVHDINMLFQTNKINFLYKNAKLKSKKIRYKDIEINKIPQFKVDEQSRK